MDKFIRKIFGTKKGQKVYADYASTTPTLPEVILAMRPFWQKSFFNPAAIYERGLEVKNTLLAYRLKVARVLGCRESEFIFTGSGTESDNLAVLGVFEAAKQAGIERPHIIATKIEHPAVMEALLEVERRGGVVTRLAVDEGGVINLSTFKNTLTPKTVLVTVIYANNEIGTIQPIKTVMRLVREYRREQNSTFPYVHTDASQAVNYLDVAVNKLGVDLMTLDGSKIYGPKGVGLLYFKHGVQIKPLMFGGGQEQGLRPGTESLALIAGFTKALELSAKDRESESQRLTPLRDKIIKSLLANHPPASLNGSADERLPNNINICFPTIDAEFAVIKLDLSGIECSFTTACNIYKNQSSSYVIEALGKKDCALSSLRITLGRGTTADEADKIIKALTNTIKKLLK